MNCMVVEADGRMAVIDCGAMFPSESVGVNLIFPDVSWLLEHKEQVGGIFVTHGHEDHIGALPHLLRHLEVPVHLPLFAQGLLEGRLREAGVKADLRQARPGDVRSAGDGSPISVEFIAVTHSIPDSCALAIRTPQGVLLHSGDFKIDEAPVGGWGMDLPRIESLGRAGVRLLLSDSTNAERPGTSASESAVGLALEHAFESAQGRIFVACFSSNVHRIQQVADAARALGRRLALLGRSMETNVRLAMELGYLKLAGWQLCSLPEAVDLSPRELCVLTTGAQAEPRGALARLARGEHPEMTLGRGDLVVLSSRLIPGNEVAVGQVVNELTRLGAEVAYEDLQPLHVSGHAHESEQRRLIALARPERFVPIHGEFRHLARHAAHAAKEGVAHCHILTDGEVLELSDLSARILEDRVAVGRVYADRDPAGGIVEELVVKDRRLLAEAGLCIVVVAIDRASGTVVRGPDIFARGVAGFDEGEDGLRAEALHALDELSAQAREDQGEVQEVLRQAVRRWFRRRGARKPSVLPVVLEL